MMLAFLYHRAGDGKYANSPDLLERHLTFLSHRHRIVLPGESLRPFSLDLCLTFDDATYDFYHYVYPILKRLHLRALLAVPVSFILPHTSLSPSLRLSVPYSEAMKGSIYRTHAPFCTWTELREMISSGHVTVASHSFTHQHLLTPNLNLDLEIAGSKAILEEQLHTPVRTFVYPLGKFNSTIHRTVKRHYEFAMRIGTAWNWSWQNTSGLTYRIISDNLTAIDQHLKPHRWLSFSWFYLLNSLRGR